MILYRLTKLIYANDLSGAGAKSFGGRWNSKGNAMLYLASSRSLAILEVLVHLPPSLIPAGYCMVTIEAPDDCEVFDTKELSPNWINYPDNYNLKQIGDRFLFKNKNLLLKVPSSIVIEEFNYLANPINSAAPKLKILKTDTFSFDGRLL